MAADEARRKVQRPPAVDACALAWELFHLRISTAEELDSYDDRNFRLWAVDGAEYTLKLHNGVESAEPNGIISAQIEALKWISGDGCISAPIDLARFEMYHHRFVARLLRFIPGDLFAKVNSERPWDLDLYAKLGSFVARVDKRLLSFDHPAAHRTHAWDLKNFTLIEAFLYCVKDLHVKEMISNTFELFRANLSPSTVGQLRQSVLHNDVNDRNVVIQPDGQLALLDFGDMCFTWTVAEVAIALGYVVIGICTFAPVIPGEPDNPSNVTDDIWLRPCAALFRAYCKEFSLTELECSVVYTLVCARVATSISLGAYSASQHPGNEAYLLLHAKPAIRALSALVRVGASRFSEHVLGTQS